MKEKKIYPLLITCVVKGTIEEYEKLIRDYPKTKNLQKKHILNLYGNIRDWEKQVKV